MKTARSLRFVIRQRLEPPLRTQPVNVPLRQHGTQPGGQAAASVEVAEERTLEELAVDAVREIARSTRWIDRVGGTIEDRPMLADEMFPGRFITGRASTRQR